MKLSLVSLALFVCLAAPAVHADTIPFTGSIQTFTITSSGTYALTAVGAQGGGDLSSNSTNIGGYGASVSGDIYLTAGTVLQVVVGGTGQAPTPVSAGGGGGGGTFIFTTGSTSPLLVAGGGGGVFSHVNGQDASTSTDGGGHSSGDIGDAGAGGTAGLGGGGGGDPAAGGGGAGWLGNGGDAINPHPLDNVARGGHGPLSFAGGSGLALNNGGFGGGGGGNGAGGGGGGYSGGGGGGGGAAGGGGSYVNAEFSNVVLTAGANGTPNHGKGLNGSFTITEIPDVPSAVPEPSSLLLLGTGIVGIAGAARRRLAARRS